MKENKKLDQKPELEPCQKSTALQHWELVPNSRTGVNEIAEQEVWEPLCAGQKQAGVYILVLSPYLPPTPSVDVGTPIFTLHTNFVPYSSPSLLKLTFLYFSFYCIYIFLSNPPPPEMALG
jgi:hypothetical protein